MRDSLRQTLAEQSILDQSDYANFAAAALGSRQGDRNTGGSSQPDDGARERGPSVLLVLVDGASVSAAVRHPILWEGRLSFLGLDILFSLFCVFCRWVKIVNVLIKFAVCVEKGR
jgi:hypothetical protein